MQQSHENPKQAMDASRREDQRTHIILLGLERVLPRYRRGRLGFGRRPVRGRDGKVARRIQRLGVLLSDLRGRVLLHGRVAGGARLHGVVLDVTFASRATVSRTAVLRRRHRVRRAGGRFVGLLDRV